MSVAVALLSRKKYRDHDAFLRARHTLHATWLVSVKGVSFLHPFSIIFDLSLPLRSLPFISCQSALQVGARLSVEEWPVSIQAYDPTFRQQNVQILLSMRLQGILAWLWGDLISLKHKHGISFPRSHVGCQRSTPTLQKMPGLLSCFIWRELLGCQTHTPYSAKSVQGQARFEGRRTPCLLALTPYPAKNQHLCLLFARLHACTSYAQYGPDKSTIHAQRQASADVMTLHSLQTVLAVG